MRTVIWADHMEGEPRPPSFMIMPENGIIQYDLGDRWPNSPQEILSSQAEVEYAWDCLARFGIDRTQFVKTNIATYGVFFPRQIDGIRFHDDSEGFSFQRFGKGANIRGFGVTFPNLHRTRDDTTATPQEIIACIRAFKTPVAPSREETDYFGRVKNMAKVKRLTITRLTPFYGEGTFGEMPPENELPPIVRPLAQLEATATFGTNNTRTRVRLFAPILSSDVERLLGNKPTPAEKRKGS